MGTMEEKWAYLKQTKALIKQAIVDKGQTVTDDATFRSYAASIANITSGNVYSMQSELNITAPKTIALAGTELLGVEKFVAGTTNTVVTEITFDNADSTDFTYDSKYVTFDGTMHPTTSYAVAMSIPTALGSGYLSTSDEFDVGQWQTVESIGVATTGEVTAYGIALVATGGRVGTWARVNSEGGSY